MFFGRYKVNDYSWLWADGLQSTYSKDVIGDQIPTNDLLLNQDGSWEMVTIDPEDTAQYGAICQKGIYDHRLCGYMIVDFYL